MVVMVPVFNAVLYAVALGLALAVVSLVDGGTSRRVRGARRVLVGVGGLAMSVAIALSFMGHWLESGIAGCVAIAIVCACMCVALTGRASRGHEDEDDGDDGGGGPRKRPEPPAPPEPAGGPTEDGWTDFDRARAGWERDRDPVGA